MSIDCKLKECLKAHLCVESPIFTQGTFLIAILRTKLSDEILILIEQFLESLSMECAQEYISRGDENGNSVLFLGHVSILTIVIKYVPNINIKNIWGNTALLRECCVAYSPDVEKIKFLVDNGANVNVANASGTVLRHFCFRISSIYLQFEDIQEILEILIHGGADVHDKSTTGKTAFDYVVNTSALSVRSSQLLQGLVRANRTKRAMH